MTLTEYAALTNYKGADHAPPMANQATGTSRVVIANTRSRRGNVNKAVASTDAAASHSYLCCCESHSSLSPRCVVLPLRGDGCAFVFSGCVYRSGLSARFVLLWLCAAHLLSICAGLELAGPRIADIQMSNVIRPYSATFGPVV